MADGQPTTRSRLVGPYADQLRAEQRARDEARSWARYVERMDRIERNMGEARRYGGKLLALPPEPARGPDGLLPCTRDGQPIYDKHWELRGSYTHHMRSHVVKAIVELLTVLGCGSQEIAVVERGRVVWI